MKVCKRKESLCSELHHRLHVILQESSFASGSSLPDDRTRPGMKKLTEGV